MFTKTLYKRLPRAFGFKHHIPISHATTYDKAGNAIEDVIVYGWWYVESHHYHLLRTPILITTVYTDKWIKSVILATDTIYD